MSEAEATRGWWTRVLAGADGNLSVGASDEQYVVLPSSSSPRVAVDRSEPRAVRDAMERMAASRTTSGAVRAIVGGASSLVTRKKPTWTVGAGSSGATLRQHLCNALDTDLRISVSVGPPRPNRKPVIRCYDETGVFAVAKLGLEPHTAAMVRNEAAWLQQLSGEPLADIVTAPVLYAGDFDGNPLLVMGALDLASDLGLSLGDVPLTVAQAFSDRHLGQDTVGTSTWWRELSTRIDPEAGVDAHLAAIAATPAFADVRVSAWHGDWSPWNMGWSRSDELCIWDWERTTTGVPVGFDLCHLHYQYGDGLDGADTDLEALGVSPDLLATTKQLYLLELCARHSEAQALSTQRHAQVVSALNSLRPVRSMS